MEIVFYIGISILSLLGLMTVIRTVVYHVFSLGEYNNICEVICLSGSNAEPALRSAISQIEWQIERKRPPVVALDLGLDDVERKICEKICKEYSIPFCNKDTVEVYLMQIT